MKNLTIYAFALALIFTSCQKEVKQESQPLAMGDLTLSKAHPMPGDQLEINYQDDQDVEAFYTYMVGTKNYPVDMDWKTTDAEKKGSITIPDSAVALAFILKTDETYDDNNEKGYLIPLYNDADKPIAGSQSALAYYSIREGSRYGITADEKDVEQTLKNDLEAHPALKKDWQAPYLQMLYESNEAEGKKGIENYLSSLSQKEDKTEADYASMMTFYRMTNQQSQSDSIKSLAIEKFPKGKSANMEIVNKFGQEQDLDKKIAIYNDYKSNVGKTGDFPNYMASNIASAYYTKNDMENFEKYSSMVDDKASKAVSLNNMAWGLAERGEHLDRAANMSKTSLDLISELKDDPKDKPDFYTQKQYENSLESSYSMYADTYALILFKQGKVKEAITYQEKAHDPKHRDAEANQRFIEYLMADQQYDQVQSKAETFIKDGYGTAKIKADYEIAYEKANPEATDFDKKLEALEKEAHKTQVAEVKKTMLDEEAPTFTLKDTQGKVISLEALKGKTVILDFWATWCGPCKASFPGMQQVVTKYKDDDNVVLLFVDTFERGENREKLVEDFIKDNDYDFHVVYDTTIEGSNNFEVADKYDVTGIPTKVVIGPDGKLKFKAVGFSGSGDKLVSEMDIMIDILKS